MDKVNKLEALLHELIAYDPDMAARAIESKLAQLGLKKRLEETKFGCHCDIENMPEGFEPDACVLDLNPPKPEHCVYAERLGKEKCGYWKPIKVIKHD